METGWKPTGVVRMVDELPGDVFVAVPPYDMLKRTNRKSRLACKTAVPLGWKFFLLDGTELRFRHGRVKRP